MVFDAGGRLAFVVNELDSTVGAYAWDPQRERLSLIQTVSTLPAAYDKPNIAADLHLVPDGRFLYASNRGHDSIAVFAVDGNTGRLTAVDCTATGGQTPRGFTLDPSGRFLLAANQDSDNIVIFAIDRDKGTLRPTGHTLDIPSPVCLKIFPPGTDAS
jgi:6-phosphogluconolactonase